MPKFGVRNPRFAPVDAESESGAYGDIVVIGEAVKVDRNITLATGELYANDILSESMSEFASGKLVVETNDILDEAASAVYGCKVVGKVVNYHKDDTPPYGGFACYEVRLLKNVRTYIGTFYPKVKAELGNSSVTTRGSNITFQTSTTTFTVFVPDDGNWLVTKEFDNEDECSEWCDEMLGKPSA